MERNNKELYSTPRLVAERKYHYKGESSNQNLVTEVFGKGYLWPLVQRGSGPTGNPEKEPVQMNTQPPSPPSFQSPAGPFHWPNPIRS